MTKLFDINRILVTIKKYGKDNSLHKEILIDKILNFHLGSDGNLAENIENCIKLNIIKDSNNTLTIDNLGTELYHLIEEIDGKKNLDGNLNQKFFLANIIQKSEILKDTKIINVLKKSKIEFSKEGIKNKINTNELASIADGIGELFIDSRLFQKEQSYCVIDNRLSDYVSKLKRGRSISEEDLYRILDIKKEVGRIAEEKCIEYEKDRLKHMGEELLSTGIIRISEHDQRLGYDVISYSGKNNDIRPDKFIEVKGTKSRNPEFFLTENEVNAARELKENYYIQLWCRVGFDDVFLFQEIKNPYEEFFENPKNVKITKSVIYNIALSEKV